MLAKKLLVDLQKRSLTQDRGMAYGTYCAGYCYFAMSLAGPIVLVEAQRGY